MNRSMIANLMKPLTLGLIVAVFLRVRMMLAAWRGVRFTLPVLGRRLEKFVG